MLARQKNFQQGVSWVIQLGLLSLRAVGPLSATAVACVR
eukprot:COSAG01_NODE_66339_length_270_cov_0.912281_1_plen_38_part_10